MGFSLEDLLAQKQQPPEDSQMAAQTYLASNETPRSLAMNDAPPPMPPPSSPIRGALASAMSQKPKPDDSEDGDDDTPTPALPAAAKSSGPMLDDLSKYKVTPEELQDAHDSKRAALMMGAIGDGLANQQSWGNYYSGKMNAHNDVMGDAQKFAALADDNIKNKQVLMKQAQAEPSNTLERYKAAMQTQQMQEMQDPNSTTSKLSKTIALGAINQIDFPADQKAEITDAIKKGNAEQINDLVNSNPLLKESFSASVAGKKLAQTMAMMQQRADQMGTKNQQGDERIHNQNIKAINNDPTVTALNNTANNLKNAISNFQQGGATTQEFNELQQAVRSNAGIKGAGGVGEREETYLKSLGINKDKFLQFISGNPQSVLDSDPKFAKQIIGVANLELGNKQKQAADALDQISAGHSRFYNAPGHEGLADDYNATLAKARSRIAPPASQASPAPAAAAGQDMYSKIGLDPSKMTPEQLKASQQQAQIELLKRRKMAGQ